MFRLGVFLLLWSVFGAAVMFYFLDRQAELQRIDAACYYYTVNGTPTAITIEGTEYRLQPDGSMDPVDRVFLNPWHEEMLRSMTYDDCIVVDTK